MALPNITDIATVDKRKRKERDLLTSCFERLVSVDAIDLAKVPKEARECWLVAKFGLEKIMAARKVVMAIPESLTDAQRKEILSDSQDAVGALMTVCDHLLTKEQAPPPAPILAPPTRSCYECGRLLVSNHKTQVRLL